MHVDALLTRRNNHMPTVLQIGANAHSADAAFAHDPVPWLIGHGWAATLVEPQPGPARSLRKRYTGNPSVRVVQGAFCPDSASSTVPLYFVNGSKTLGANESDIRCLGEKGAVSGTASFSRALVAGNQRFYRFTPSQCANCAKMLGRPLPPTCMRRVYADNLDVVNVSCVRQATELFDSGAAASSESSSARISLAVIDCEGEDDHVVGRLLEMISGQPPEVLVYEQSHLKGHRRSTLASKLRALGMTTYNRSTMKQPPAGSALSQASWGHLRHVLNRMDTSRDNAAWTRGRAAS